MSIPIKDLPGLTKTQVTVSRKKGFGACAVRQQGNARIVVDCTRVGPPRIGSLVLCIRMPVSAAPTGNPGTLKARAAIRGLKRAGWSQVSIEVRPRTPSSGGPIPPRTPPRPTFREGQATDCPVGGSGPRELTVAPGARPGMITSREFKRDELNLDRQGRVTQVICRYRTTPAGLFDIIIRWSYGDEDRRSRAGACDDPPGAPFLTTTGNWVSTKRQVHATKLNFQIILVDPAETTIMTALLTKLENEKVGASCE